MNGSTTALAAVGSTSLAIRDSNYLQDASVVPGPTSFEVLVEDLGEEPFPSIELWLDPDHSGLETTRLAPNSAEIVIDDVQVRELDGNAVEVTVAARVSSSRPSADGTMRLEFGSDDPTAQIQAEPVSVVTSVQPKAVELHARLGNPPAEIEPALRGSVGTTDPLDE